jgi:hypothetical protein
MNSKNIQSEILKQIFINYEKEIDLEKQRKHQISNSYIFNDSKINDFDKNLESNNELILNLNIDINIKYENYNGNKRPINKMKQKLLNIKHCRRISS